MDASEFQKLIKNNDRLRMALYSFVTRYIGQISQKAICNMYHSVRERLCTWLLMVQDRCGSSNLKLTHDQMARTLGVYRPSVSFTTQELRESKLINYTRGALSIRDRKSLERAACSCYSEMSGMTPDLGV
jgi:CRP-like cAMP-binding protein